MGIFRLRSSGDPKEGLVPSDSVAPECFTTDDRTEVIHYAHLNEETGVSSGTWKCAPCREVFEAYPVDEMMTVLEGSVTLTDASGEEQTFVGGDTFFLAKGTPLTWEITETMLKYFMISE